MHDDVTRGACAPIEADGALWDSVPDVNPQDTHSPSDEVRVGLTAVVLSVRQEQPVAIVCPSEVRQAPKARVDQGSMRLPGGRFCPLEQASLEGALRSVVHQGAGRELGYIEQLLTDYAPFEDEIERHAAGGPRQLSISYLALTRADTSPLADGARWIDCYELLPWEDFRGGRPGVLSSHILPGLEAWCASGTTDATPSQDCETQMSRSERVAVSFGLSGRSWDDQRVVDRLDLLCEAGLFDRIAPTQLSRTDVRLIAAGLGRLRAKIRYRPVVFELLPPEFTLFELQRTVEAVLGPTLHKQNFRRLVEGTGLVEPTGDVRNNTGGRPAKTFRFRREVLLERPAPGVHVRPGRAA